MNGPGISLFQGNEPIKLNNSNQQEEEEFLEDEKIRNAELQSLINKAFSDLDEDDDTSVSSSHCSLPCENGYNSTQNSAYSKYDENSRNNSTSADYSSSRIGQMRHNYPEHSDAFQHMPYRGDAYEVHENVPCHSPHKDHCFQEKAYGQNVSSNHVEAYKQAEFNGVTQLKVMYDIRLREIEQLKNDLEAEREEKEHIIRKLNVCEHEKKDLELKLNSSQTLLTESRNRIMELDQEISLLKENIKAVEKSKGDVENELEIAKEQLLHQQQKYIALERSDINVKREKQMDLVIQSLNAKHRTEINFLQQQLDSAIERINRKEDDYKNLEKKLEEMEQKHAVNLLNKCDSTMRQEATVKALLDEANKDKLELTRKITTLQQECNMLRSDLEQYEVFPHLKLPGNSSSDEKETDSFILLSSGWKTESKKKSMDLIQTDVVAKLKEELHRALIGQRTKRKEIMKLREQLEIKELQMTKMKEQEKVYLQQTESLKEDMNRVLEQAAEARSNNKASSEQIHLISTLQVDIEAAKKENREKNKRIVELEEEIGKIKEKLIRETELIKTKHSQDYLTFYENEIAKLKKANEELMKTKDLEWGREMEKLLTECDEVKQLYLEIKVSKEKLSENLNELKIKYDEALKEKQILRDQLTEKEELVKDLQDRILLLVKEKKMVEETIKNDFQKEYKFITEKQKDEINDLKSKLKDASSTEEEIKKLKNEISLTKQTYQELEKSLKSKFEAEMMKLNEEILRESHKKKETDISLRKSCLTQKKDIATATDELMVIETIYQRNFDEIKKLEKEVDRLRSLEEEKSVEILKLKASYERRLDEELQELEKNLSSKHQKELLLAENRVKELSLKYFTEEIEKLQHHHIKDLHSVRDEENQKLIHLKNILDEKEKLVNSLNSKIEDFENLIKAYEEERNKAALMMMQWAKEVEALKKDKEDVVKELENIKTCNKELLSAFEDTKIKLRNTRKAALVYKRRLNEIKMGLSERYKNLLLDIQHRVDEAVAEKEVEIEVKLNEIEKEYKNKEKLLKLDLENRLDS